MASEVMINNNKDDVGVLCENCQGINFQALSAHDRKSGYYVLHHSQTSYSRSLAKGCALCILIGSQLGEVELTDDICDQLQAFMVLKRRWPSPSTSNSRANEYPVCIHSRLGFATLNVIDPLPSQYQDLSHRDIQGNENRKRKRGQDEAASSSTRASHRHSTPLDGSSHRQTQIHHTGSPENMRLARQWIKDCFENHDICALGSVQNQDRFLPTRLIDTQDPDCPFLVAGSKTVGSEYIALSYAWGNGARFTTNKENFRHHQTRIPLESAPKTFIEAIQVTRDLGYRYIWIDGLCMIQDDDDDRDRELSIMGQIYQHATLTIYAEGSSSVSGGLFQQRDPHLYRPCAVNIKTTTEEGVLSEQLTLSTVVTSENYLKKRGWILQEEVLTSRCLSFGKQMRWQCAAGEASETRPVPSARKTALTHGRATCEDKLKLWLYAPSQMKTAPRDKWFRWNQYDAWYAVMEEYSTKNLSFSKDHLNALTGLATLFQQAHHATYLAGLWKEDLQHGLAWYVSSNDSRPVREARDQMPSWSWVSVGLVRLKFRAWAPFSTHLVIDGAEILDASCTPSQQANPLGSAQNGLLKLRTRVKKIRLSWSAAYVTKRTEFSHGSYSGSETTTMARGEHPRFPARIFELGSSQCIGEAALDRGICAHSITEMGDIEAWCALLHVQKTSDCLRLTALVLEEDKSKPITYRRVGLVFTSEKHEDENPLADWVLREINIV